MMKNGGQVRTVIWVAVLDSFSINQTTLGLNFSLTLIFLLLRFLLLYHFFAIFSTTCTLKPYFFIFQLYNAKLEMAIMKWIFLQFSRDIFFY